MTAKAKAKKDEMAASWNAVAADVPKMIEAVKSRVDILSQSKKLPKGLDKATFDTAKNDLASATSAWARGLGRAGRGQVERRDRQGQRGQGQGDRGHDRPGHAGRRLDPAS